MEEAIVDVALDLHLHSSEPNAQEDVRQGTRTNHQDQAQLLSLGPRVEQVSSIPNEDDKPQTSSLSGWNEEMPSPWPQDRAARVEALRACVANGTYAIDSADLARCMLRNSTRFVETC
jgi:anti-sigma28 factor (negative regulator of flagellin synthesis)